MLSKNPAELRVTKTTSVIKKPETTKSLFSRKDLPPSRAIE